MPPLLFEALFQRDDQDPNGHQGDVWRWIAKCRKALAAERASRARAIA